MHKRHWLRLVLAGFVWAALLAAPGLPLPGTDRLGFAGTAAAQETIDIDTFYDELAPYGQWVWHPRFGYVWLPENVSPRWRPYTVGRWVDTEEYGWYWNSPEPFAWAVYHYGRWGYDEDYGWFWVPGDTWAPAWVQWRYSDNYVGWAPVGPGRPGYAYGVPVSYEPPIAESWVFVQPRYMTSRVISHYAVPIAGLGVVFLGATNVYRPIYRGGVVYNYGMPRDRLVKITRRPIYVQKIYRVNDWKGGRFDKDDRNKGIKIYQPRFNKDGRPNRGPKKFVDNPKDFKPKAKLNDTFKGDVPKEFGRRAKDVKSIAKEDPDAFKKKPGRFDGPGDFGDKGKDKDRDKDRDKDKGQAKGTEPPPIQKVIRQQDDVQNGKVGATDGQGDRDGRDKDRGKDKGQASKDFDRDGKQGRKGDGDAPPPPPPVVKGVTGEPTTGKVGATDGRGDRDGRDNKDKSKDKPKTFGDPGGPNQFKQGKRDQDGQGGGGQGKKKDFDGPSGANQFKQGNRDQDGQGGGQRKQKSGPDGQGGQGGGQDGQGGQRAQGQGGGGGGGGDKKDKCKKNPDHPSCQN